MVSRETYAARQCTSFPFKMTEIAKTLSHSNLGNGHLHVNIVSVNLDNILKMFFVQIESSGHQSILQNRFKIIIVTLSSKLTAK